MKGRQRMTSMQSLGNSTMVLPRALENVEPAIFIQGPKRPQNCSSTSSMQSVGSTEYSCLQKPELGGPKRPLTDGRWESLQKLDRS